MNLFDALLNTEPSDGADAPNPPVRLSTVNVLPAELPNVPSSNVNMSLVRLPATVNPPPVFFASCVVRFEVGEVLSLHAMIATIATDRGKRGFIRSLRDRQILLPAIVPATDLHRRLGYLDIPRSFCFADRSHGRGAFIVGGWFAKHTFAN